jgi:hypothetical protein
MGKIDHFSGFCAEADKQNADHSALEQIDRELDQQFTNIGSFREGRRISREQFWVDASGAIFFQLRYGKQPLELEKGGSHQFRKRSEAIVISGADSAFCSLCFPPREV